MGKFRHFLRWHGLMALVATLAMGMTLASCSDDDDDDDASSLVGTWMLTQDTGYGTEIVCYSFNADGSGFYFDRDEDEMPDETRYDYFRDYNLDGEVLYILWDEESEYDEDGRIRDITDNTFRYRYDDDEDWVTFHRVD